MEDASRCLTGAHRICRFSIPFDGSLTVTIGPWQAIAVHTGALGKGLPIPEVATQVSVIFSETATTTLGEVSAPSNAVRAREDSEGNGH